MRVATIGDDGRIYEANGNAFGPAKQGVFRQKKVPTKRIRGRALYGLGQTAEPQAPAMPTTSAYKVAREIALPIQGMSFSFTGTDPNTIYPGRLVVSDRYPGILFRVSTLPPTMNYPNLVKLAALEGQGAGDYIEIQIQPDGSGQPALLQDFLVVPADLAWKVEFILVVPEPIFAGKPDGQRASLQYLTGMIDQASYMIGTLDFDLTPAGFSDSYPSTFNQVAAAVAMGSEAIRNVGIAWDFGYIGERAFKILARVGSDVFDRTMALFDMLSPTSPNSLVGTTDTDRILDFQRKATEAFSLRSYWSALLSRAMLFTMATNFAYLVAADDAGSATENYSCEMKVSFLQNRAAIENGMVSTGGITPQEATAKFDQGMAILDGSLSGTATNRAYIEKSLVDFFGASLTLEQIPMALIQMNTMLDYNAQLVLSIREDLRNLATGGISVSDDLGRVPDLSGNLGQVPISKRIEIAQTIDKALGSTLEGRIRKLKAEYPNEGQGELRTRALEQIRQDILSIKGVVSSIMSWDSLKDVPTLSQIQLDRLQAADNMNRTEVGPAANKKARSAARDPDPTVLTKTALDRFSSELQGAYDLMGKVPTTPDGKPKDFETWTADEIRLATDSRDQAVKKFADVLTQGFIKMKADGTYESEASGYLGAKKTTFKGVDAATKIMKGILDSGLFESAYIKAELYRIVSNDLGVTTSELSKYLSDQIVQFSNELGSGQLGEEAAKTRQKQIEGYNSILKIIGDEKASDYARAQLETLASWTEIYQKAGREGKEALPSPDSLAEAKGRVDRGTRAIADAQALIDSYAGPTADSALKTMMSLLLTGNVENAAALKKALGDFTQANSALDALTKNLESGSKRVTLQMLTEAMYRAIDALGKLELAQEPVSAAVLKWSLSKFVSKVFSWSEYWWKATTLKSVMDLAKNNMLAGFVVAILGLPLHYGILWAVPIAILGLRQKDYNPGLVIVEAERKALGLLPDPRVGDIGAAGGDTGEGGGARPAPGGIPTIAWVAGAFAVMVFGKQLFPAVGEFFKALTVSLTTITKIIPGAGGKKKKGRPKGDEKEHKVVGRGRPANVKDLVDELKEARAEGDDSREQNIVKKLKRAAERGQSVPAGLWGYYWR